MSVFFHRALPCFIILFLLHAEVRAEAPSSPQESLLTPEESLGASANYAKYCALCHGDDRQGYANGYAPSLRSKSLIESGIPVDITKVISHGRSGTAMGAYLDEVGGPMSSDEIRALVNWLCDQSGGHQLMLNPRAAVGNLQLGESLYQQECASCHGAKGEGTSAPALGSPSAHLHHSDAFIRYAIENGRQDTPMLAYKEKLSSEEIDSITVYIRSLAKDAKPEPVTIKPLPTPEIMVINPHGEAPEFDLQNGLHVMAADLAAALSARKKMFLIDTRVTSSWQISHIEGAYPLPYFSTMDQMYTTLPKDVMIVAYCSCPRESAETVVKMLRNKGFSKTAVLYEGFLGYQAQGFTVFHPQSKEDSSSRANENSASPSAAPEADTAPIPNRNS